MRSRLTGALRGAVGQIYGAWPHFLSYVRGKAIILMYHRVLPAAEVSSTYVQPAMYVTSDTFERHLAFLKEHVEVVPLSDLLEKWTTGTWDPSARYCALTFDDGWLDNYRHAYPLLRAYAAPATIFLPTDLIGSGESLWSDRLGRLLAARRRGTPDEWNADIERAKTLADGDRQQLIDALAADAGDDGRQPTRAFMNWDEVAEMSCNGISFGSHTATHADLTRLSPPALERELRAPLEVLRARAITTVPMLAYPNGDYTATVAAAAQAAGYRAALTTRPGLEDACPDLFALKRIAVHEDVSRSAASLSFHIARTAGRWAC
jgi:peptidoglycan/xylan/chitin deacetylase (PgdA/CDA1 family)